MSISNFKESAIGNRKSAISVFVFVLVFVHPLFFYDIQFDRIEAHDLQFCSTLFTRHYFALVRVQIDVDISITFRASSGRHSLILPALSEGRDSPLSGEYPLPCKQPNQSTRERRNLQQSFSEIIGPRQVTFLCRKIRMVFFASLRLCGRNPLERFRRIFPQGAKTQREISVDSHT